LFAALRLKGHLQELRLPLEERWRHVRARGNPQLHTKSARYLTFNPLRFSLPAPQPAPESRQGLIAKAAYLRAERRGFAPGHELEDWLAAEFEVARTL
jgi:hypothetical protein